MATVKTALSIDDSLFEQAEALAKELNVSRSKVFAMALEEFLRKRQGEKLLEQINSVYAEVSSPDREEEEARRAKHRELVEGTW